MTTARSIPAITSRDLAILTMVYEYAGCSASHIRARFFPTPGGRSACYGRIAKLVANRYLVSRRLPAQSGQGSGKALLTLGVKGRPLVAQVLGLVTRQDLARLRIDAPRYIEHHLALCDTRLCFERACLRSRLFQLVDWQGDRAVRIEVTDPLSDERLALVPDGRFTLGLRDDRQQSFLLEQDLGTIPRRMRARLRLYLARDATAGREPVLWIVPDARRQEAVLGWAQEEATRLSADPTMHWVALTQQIESAEVLRDPLWRIAGVAQPVALQSVALGRGRPAVAVPPAGPTSGAGGLSE